MANDDALEPIVVRAFPYKLSDAEILALHRNPYEVLEGRPKLAALPPAP